MEFLRKFWPFSFETKSVSNLVIKAIIYVVVASLFGALIGLCGKVAVLNVIMYILGPVVDIYMVAGLVILFLNYFKVLK